MWVKAGRLDSSDLLGMSEEESEFKSGCNFGEEHSV